MKINEELIARTALRLLNDSGLGGLTMRQVATELGVRTPTLYWHLKNKQQLLDAMAALIFSEATERLEAPRAGVTWDDWLADLARELRGAMLRYRDGARVLAGSYVDHPALHRTVELTLGALQDAGFSLEEAAYGVPALLHYTIGCTIEEQARTGADYGDGNPYDPERLEEMVDAGRYPLTARMLGVIFAADADAAFERGMRVILLGLRASSGDGGGAGGS
ncbi:TetR/AcrR family transcriptional regulator C-terminal domain-containing protein [Streptomyces sp. ODS28]|uniref:TetR/AcrR family transcriptional regulator C-terminal domain-containing protein n=1 Tax=Streptomyces sp. ODS28 TaxID=3136688 RepID=UPI0031EDD042